MVYCLWWIQYTDVYSSGYIYELLKFYIYDILGTDLKLLH